MLRRPPRSTRTDTLFPYTTLFRSKLAGGFLLEPKVSVQVASFRPVYVLGEVNKPGEYPYTQGLTIRGAVAKADGFTYRANEKRVFLKRAGEAGEREYELTADFPVLPGGTIQLGRASCRERVWQYV